VDGVELDCRLSADGHVVVYHDSFLKGEFCDVNTTQRIENTTLSNLKKLRYKHLLQGNNNNNNSESSNDASVLSFHSTTSGKTSNNEAGVTNNNIINSPISSFHDNDNIQNHKIIQMPLLEDVLDLVAAKNVLLFLEIKESGGIELVDKILALLSAKFPATESSSSGPSPSFVETNILFLSFNPWIVRHIKQKNSNYSVCYLIDAEVLLYWPLAEKDVYGFNWLYSFADNSNISFEEEGSKNVNVKKTVNNKLLELIDVVYTFAAFFILPVLLQADVVGPNQKQTSPEYVKFMEKMGIRTSLWTVNEPEDVVKWHNCHAIVTTDWCFPKLVNSI